jgi:hypothetical protein
VWLWFWFGVDKNDGIGDGRAVSGAVTGWLIFTAVVALALSSEAPRDLAVDCISAVNAPDATLAARELVTLEYACAACGPTLTKKLVTYCVWTASMDVPCN